MDFSTVANAWVDSYLDALVRQPPRACVCACRERRTLLRLQQLPLSRPKRPKGHAPPPLSTTLARCHGTAASPSASCMATRPVLFHMRTGVQRERRGPGCKDGGAPCGARVA